jgi:hypothetical protein
MLGVVAFGRRPLGRLLLSFTTALTFSFGRYEGRALERV